jgi:hypothetical protein
MRKCHHEYAMSFRSWLSRRKRQSLYTADPLSLAEKSPRVSDCCGSFWPWSRPPSGTTSTLGRNVAAAGCMQTDIDCSYHSNYLCHYGYCNKKFWAGNLACNSKDIYWIEISSMMAHMVFGLSCILRWCFTKHIGSGIVLTLVVTEVDKVDRWEVER